MKKRNSGFTLVELICVLAIISIISAIAVPNIAMYINKSKKNNCDSVMANVVNNVKSHVLSKRFGAEASVNEKLENTISGLSDKEITFHLTKDADGHISNNCETDGICPNGGTYKLSWNMNDGASDAIIKLDFKYSCNCGSNSEEKSFSTDVLMRTEDTDYYEYLKSVALVVYKYAQEEAKREFALGGEKDIPYYICKRCSGIVDPNTKYIEDGNDEFNDVKRKAETPVYLYEGTSSKTIQVSTVLPAIKPGSPTLFAGIEDSLIWGMTLDENCNIEWMCFYCKYKDTDGTDYKHFIAIENGEVVTTKEDYCNLSNKENYCPAEGNLGSSTYKVEWVDGPGPVIIGEQVKYKENIGYLGPEQGTTPWIQRDSTWYIEAWGKFSEIGYSEKNIFSHRKLKEISVTVTPPADAWSAKTEIENDFNKVFNYVKVNAIYEDGFTFRLSHISNPNMITTSNTAINVERMLNKRKFDAEGKWFLTNGYVLVDNNPVTANKDWTMKYSSLDGIERNEPGILNQLYSLLYSKVKFTIAYQEYYKYLNAEGKYEKIPITCYATFEIQLKDGKVSVVSEPTKSAETPAVTQPPVVAPPAETQPPVTEAPVVTQPAEDYANSDFRWVTCDNGVTITKYLGDSSVVEFPEKVKGYWDGDTYNPDNGKEYNVVSLGMKDGNASIEFKNISNISEIKIGNSVTQIKDRAFMDLTNVSADLYIPESVTVIKGNAFKNFGNGDGALHIYASATVATEAFSGAKFTNVIIGGKMKNIPTNLLQGNSNIKGTICILDEVETIGNGAFECCSGVSTLVIGNGVSKIGSNTFKQMLGCKSITIPQSVREIGDSAFNSCSNVETLVIENGVTKIGQNAFQQMFACSNLTIPQSVKEIGVDAFQNFGNGNGELYIYGGSADNGKTITNVFRGAKFNGVTIGGNIEAIDANAFSNNGNLKGSLIIGSSVKSIGSEAFFGCNNFNGCLTFECGFDNIKNNINRDSAFRRTSFANKNLYPEINFSQ